MSLTVGSRIIAEIRIQSATLRPVVGAYELSLSLHIAVNPGEDQQRFARVAGAHVTLKTTSGQPQAMGFARPEIPITIRPKKFPTTLTPVLRLTLQSRQLAAIEDFRGSGDLAFELLAVGEGVDVQTEYDIQDNWRIDIPRSAWIEELRRSRAMDILLLEVPMPLGEGVPEEWRTIADSLARAQKSFFDGDYHSCVSLCRGVVHDLGHMRFSQQDWASALLDRLANDPKAMLKDDREAAILAVIRHYTHQAHHSESEGGVTDYFRSEAKMILTITAALVARAQGR